MNRERREMAVWEKKSRTEIMKKDVYKNYIRYYLLLGISIFWAFVLGFSENTSKWEVSTMSFYFFVLFVAIHVYEDSLIHIKESGKNRNIFYKYIYVPVSLKDLYWAKMFVIGTDIIKIVLIEQVLAVLARCIDGGDFSYMGQMLMPLYVGMVLILYFGAILGWNCRRCMKEC